MELIKAASTKSCEVDPIPTTLLKTNLKECKIINQALQSGRVPSILKTANVGHLLSEIDPRLIIKNIDQS